MIQFKKQFTLPTPDFQKCESKELTVRLNINEGEVNNQVPEYSLVIPDFMFNELKDTEPQFKTEYDVNNRNVSGCFSNRTITRKFQKTQTSVALSILTDYIGTLTQHIIDKHSVETSTEKKKIFILFRHSQSHYGNSTNSAYMGEAISQSFRYFTGYEVMTDKFSSLTLEGRQKKKMYMSKIYYAPPSSSLRKNDTNFAEKDNLFLDLRESNQSTENFENEYSIIDWTPEREAYCERIKQSFIKVNAELSLFLKNMTTEKMDALIADNHLALNPVNITPAQ